MPKKTENKAYGVFWGQKSFYFDKKGTKSAHNVCYALETLRQQTPNARLELRAVIVTKVRDA